MKNLTVAAASIRTYVLSLLRHSMITLLLVLLFFTACGAPAPDVGRDNPQDQPVNSGMAPLESIETLILESFPAQVRVLVRGNLPDSCTEIGQINWRSDLENNAFWVEITTVCPTDKACVKAPVPFEETILLDVYGLPAGTYTVDVNGVRDTFTLDLDNVSPEGEAPPAGLPNPAAVYCEDQGYTVEIRTDENGSQYGVCVFPNGSECEEWTFYRGECGPATTTEGALSASELLQDPVYDTEVEVHGQVGRLGELFCPCFELTSDGNRVTVWYGLMVEDDGTERPAVSVEGTRNGDWVVVTGELKRAGAHESPSVWASKIEKAE